MSGQTFKLELGRGEDGAKSLPDAVNALNCQINTTFSHPGNFFAAPIEFLDRILYNTQHLLLGDYTPEKRTRMKMPYAVVEKEVEQLDKTQQNAVVPLVGFPLLQKTAAPFRGRRLIHMF